MPVQRVVGGVEIERDLRRRGRMGVERQIDKQPFDRRRVMADLVTAGWLLPAQLQPIERRFAGPAARNRRAVPQACRRVRHHRVAAQLVVVVQILVAQRNPQHPLTHQARHLVHH